jgi:putative NADH-flavin reductase
MKIVVFGSTGRAGSAVVERALDMGSEVTAFARSPERLAWLEGRKGLHIALGDALDAASVEEALKDGEAVISALGSGTLDPTTHLSEMTTGLVNAMRATGPRRLVALSHVGVLLKKVDPQYQHVAEEHRRNLRILEESELDWVAVCPPGIVSEPAHGHVEVVAGARAPNWTISRFDLADFMIEQTQSGEFLNQAVGISN